MLISKMFTDVPEGERTAQIFSERNRPISTLIWLMCELITCAVPALVTSNVCAMTAREGNVITLMDGRVDPKIEHAFYAVKSMFWTFLY